MARLKLPNTKEHTSDDWKGTHFREYTTGKGPASDNWSANDYAQDAEGLAGRETKVKDGLSRQSKSKKDFV